MSTCDELYKLVDEQITNQIIQTTQTAIEQQFNIAKQKIIDNVEQCVQNAIYQFYNKVDDDIPNLFDYDATELLKILKSGNKYNRPACFQHISEYNNYTNIDLDDNKCFIQARNQNGRHYYYLYFNESIIIMQRDGSNYCNIYSRPHNFPKNTLFAIKCVINGLYQDLFYFNSIHVEGTRKINPNERCIEQHKWLIPENSRYFVNHHTQIETFLNVEKQKLAQKDLQLDTERNEINNLKNQYLQKMELYDELQLKHDNFVREQEQLKIDQMKLKKLKMKIKKEMEELEQEKQQFQLEKEEFYQTDNIDNLLE